MICNEVICSGHLEILSKVRKLCGNRFQVVVCMEELNELIVELVTCLEHNKSDARVLYSNEAFSDEYRDLLAEISDVILTSNHIKEIYGITLADIENTICYSTLVYAPHPNHRKKFILHLIKYLSTLSTKLSKYIRYDDEALAVKESKEEVIVNLSVVLLCLDSLCELINISVGELSEMVDIKSTKLDNWTRTRIFRCKPEEVREDLKSMKELQEHIESEKEYQQLVLEELKIQEKD